MTSLPSTTPQWRHQSQGPKQSATKNEKRRPERAPPWPTMYLCYRLIFIIGNQIKRVVGVKDNKKTLSRCQPLDTIPIPRVIKKRHHRSKVVWIKRGHIGKKKRKERYLYPCTGDTCTGATPPTLPPPEKPWDSGTQIQCHHRRIHDASPRRHRHRQATILKSVGLRYTLHPHTFVTRLYAHFQLLISVSKFKYCLCFSISWQ